MRTICAFAFIHGNSAEWCSYGPINTIGGDFNAIADINICMAPVAPDPVKITASFSDALIALRITCRASVRNRVDCWAGLDFKFCYFYSQDSFIELERN